MSNAMSVLMMGDSSASNTYEGFDKVMTNVESDSVWVANIYILICTHRLLGRFS